MFPTAYSLVKNDSGVLIVASWERLRTDDYQRMLVPMNVDGGIRDTNFFNGFKMATLLICGFGSFAFCAYVYDLGLGWIINTILTTAVVLLDILAIRYLIIEERYYMRMYKKMKQYEVTTADIFWNIANLRETDQGTLLVYSDLKVGVLLRLERDTVIGRPAEYKELHFDAVSEFYKALNVHNLNFVQVSLMEPTGKDPRLNKLDDVVQGAKFNPNLFSLLESTLGYTKNITRVTLFETDYILIYTDAPSRSDYLIQEVNDCCEKLSQSSFVSYSILNASEILDLMREMYDIKYFDMSSAILRMFDSSAEKEGKAFELIGIEYTDGSVKELTKSEKAHLERIQELLDEGTITKADWSIQEALKGKLTNVGNSAQRADRESEEEDNTVYADIGQILFSDSDEDIIDVSALYSEAESSAVKDSSGVLTPKTEKLKTKLTLQKAETLRVQSEAINIEPEAQIPQVKVSEQKTPTIDTIDYEAIYREVYAREYAKALSKQAQVATGQPSGTPLADDDTDEEIDF